jgi:YVTN family beta-propeller protein
LIKPILRRYIPRNLTGPPMNRRHLLALATVPLPGRLAHAQAPAGDWVYVINSADASLSVLDAATRTELRRIPMLREPHHMVVTPSGQELVIGDAGGHELVFLDPATGDIRRRERISNPYHLEYSPDGRFLVIASLRRDQIDIYEADTLRLLHRFRQPDKPSHVAFSPDSRFVFITLQGTGEVAAVDMQSRATLWVREVGPEPAGIIWHRGRLLIGLMGREEVASLDPATGVVTEAFQIGRGAHNIFAAPDGRFLYATSRVDSRIAQVDAATLKVTKVFDIPGGPDCLAFDPEGKIWATLRWVGRALFLDPVTGEQAQIRVGRSPHGIFAMPRRPGIGAGFAFATAAATSGPRPLPRPTTDGTTVVRGPASGPPIAVAPAPPVIRASVPGR